MIYCDFSGDELRNLIAKGNSVDKEILTNLTELWKKGIKLKKFKPFVHEHENLGYTEMILEDTSITWSGWQVTRHMGYAVDLGYNAQGKLVGIKIWDKVENRK